MIRRIGLALVVIGALAGCQAKYESQARVTAATQNAESAAARAEAAAHRVEQAAGRAEAAAQRAEAVAQKVEDRHQEHRRADR
jgi:hypothetical protein